MRLSQRQKNGVTANVLKMIPLTPGSGIPSPMTVKQMKTSDVAAIRCSRVRVDSKGTSLDAVPRGQITPFLEKVEMLLGACMYHCR